MNRQVVVCGIQVPLNLCGGCVLEEGAQNEKVVNRTKYTCIHVCMYRYLSFYACSFYMSSNLHSGVFLT